MRRDHRPQRLTVAVLGLGLALALAACGGSPDGDPVASLSGDNATGTTAGAAKTPSKDPQQAALDFARCMREHGIDMPDPTGDGLMLRREGENGPDPESEKFQEAERACDHHLANLGRGRRESGGGS
jgi:hypothetical protein